MQAFVSFLQKEMININCC